jgi:vacuolar protein sorting-associated protein 13A/C
MSLWNGQVKLQGLNLRTDIFSRFKIPLDIVYGFLFIDQGKVDNLVLVIPWNDLRNKPLKITVGTVFILANPSLNNDYDPEAEELAKQELKTKKLREAEEALAKSLKENSTLHAYLDSKNSYFNNIWNAVVDNLQITIKNIHIRFEDCDTPERPFGVGITLGELSAVSADANWNTAGPIPVNTGIVYKLLTLGYFGTYCNTESKVYAGLTPQEMYDRFLDSIQKTTNVSPSAQYIVNPVSGLGKLIWVKNPTQNRPLFELNVDFDTLAINLDDKQYQTFIYVVTTLSSHQLAFPFRKFRPPKTITVKLDPKAWLQYAMKCVLHQIHKKRYQWSWEHFKKRRDQRKLYIDLHKKLREETIMEDVYAE